MYINVTPEFSGVFYSIMFIRFKKGKNNFLRITFI